VSRANHTVNAIVTLPRLAMNYPAASCGVSKNIDENLSQRRHPRMVLSGVQSCFGSAQHDPELRVCEKIGSWFDTLTTNEMA